jgi:hypothetical protein
MGYEILLSPYEVGTTLKPHETINGKVKNLSKRTKRKDYH